MSGTCGRLGKADIVFSSTHGKEELDEIRKKAYGGSSIAAKALSCASSGKHSRKVHPT